MQWLIALSVDGAGMVDRWPFGVLLSIGRLDGGGLNMVVRIGWL